MTGVSCELVHDLFCLFCIFGSFFVSGCRGGMIPPGQRAGHNGFACRPGMFVPACFRAFSPPDICEEKPGIPKDMKYALSGFPRTLARLFMLNWLFLLLARGAMLALLWESVHADGGELMRALYIGAKFDMRVAVFGLIPLGLVLAVPGFDAALAKPPARGRWNVPCTALVAVYILLFLAVSLVYVVDFGYFFYLRQRIDISVLEFLGNTDISGRMVLESYPVPAITVAVLAVTAVHGWLVRCILRDHRPTPPLGWKKRTGLSLAVFTLCFLMAYAQISSNLFPLRWSNAYFSVNKDMAILALNPVQNLRDSAHSMRGIPPNMEAVRQSYPDISQWLGIQDRTGLNMLRHFSGERDGNGMTRRMNVVILIMESLAWPKTSLAPGGADADSTPNLAVLARESAYFPNFYAPTRTTARAIFTTMTGIPDVNRSGGTSSRNQGLVDQFVLMNEFEGYEKFYMIGGSASWANIRGVLSGNIDGLHLLEEEAWDAPNVDVWGVSDLALLRETARKLDKTPEPFVVVVQTAGFHRPYTIPGDNAGFVVRELDSERLRRQGFTGNDEYNSLRFSDHALGEFFRIARRMPWFENTVFAIFGDHGLNDPPGNVSPGYLACHLQDSHVPLLVYAPGLAGRQDTRYRPGVYPQPCGQPDVFPTLARLAGLSFRYTGMGRDLFDPATRETARQFVAGNEEPFFRIVEDGYCYIRENDEALYRLDDPLATNLVHDDPDRADRMRRFAQEYFHVAKYVLYNNRKEYFD